MKDVIMDDMNSLHVKEIILKIDNELSLYKYIVDEPDFKN
jgi:hypothetical protein